MKNTGAKTWAGVTLAEEAVGVQLVTADHPTVTLHVYAPESGMPIMMQLKDTSTNTIKNVSVDTTTVGWQTMTFDFTDVASNGFSYNQMSMFPDFEQPTLTDQVFYFDDVRFLDAVAGTTDPVLVPQNADPVFSSATETVSVEENIDEADVIYTAQANDTDGDDLTYSLGGTDASAFEIDEDTGEVTFVASPDYESGVTSYSFTVTADDDNGGQATQDVTVNITDVTEVPPNLLIDFEGASPLADVFGGRAGRCR